MSLWHQAAWLLWALLLLAWVPGCSSISGPTSVSGPVGGSLSVKCSYEERLREYPKYWCKPACFRKIVETKESDREVRSGRVSIRDHPANLTFTVTLENLVEDDAGTYRCGVDTFWLGTFGEPTLTIEVSVTPATTSTRPANTIVTQISTTTAGITTTPSSYASTVSSAVGATHSASSQKEFQQSQGLGLQVLLSLLALLLLLLGGSLFLAWRMLRKRKQVKAGENPEPLRAPSQDTLQSEPYYANLELQMLTLQGEPAQPRQEEVEYSTVKAPEELHYSSVAFDSQSQDSKAKETRSQRTLEQEPEYSAIKKT
ncbi:CMRF35-like molecule 8 isoform X1 [Hyaena hyaena]|uniref:CMRF35-like molecule 8 isoform X1 n=1 Tax=Hyaena hyaena TaxID=95912 RepID=UPI001920B1F8|nr:CMRF35-like molecule 8 isoform X1 [Hyaena hyaena]XP_039085738.1 CMRF35-like molecule 8 isoform X1 [Hyaena hyaena]XP_039085739.1 CMRF35-like molecule 8 isoform X1 [Hyaena hyaena]XP_039085740.1 CMRF35-like molecule 8 isoform X1 [Hyaena hyaena]